MLVIHFSGTLFHFSTFLFKNYNNIKKENYYINYCFKANLRYEKNLYY